MTSILRPAIALSILTAAWCLAPAPLFSQEEHQEEHEAQNEEGREGTEHEGEEHEGHHHHPNELGLMLGGTYEYEEGDTFFTIGAEYLRLINQQWGVSLVVEHISEVDAWVFIVPAVLRPWKTSEFNIKFGPGFENKSRRGGGHGGEHVEGPSDPGVPVESEQGENLFLWRTGVGYAFHFSERWVVQPAIDWDVVREHGEWVNAIVFGVSIGFGF